MRLALLGLAASFSALPLTAQDLRVSQSPVTISATFSRPGAEKAPVDRPADNDVNVRTPTDAVRYGNSQLLDTLVAADVIPEKRGWRIVAVWANWPGRGNAYKFFLRKKGEDPIEILDSQIKLEFTDPFVAKNVTLKNGKVVSGSETHKSLATLSLTAITDTNENTRDSAAGTATGLVYGTGNYFRPAKADTAVYRPVADTFTGYGQIDNPGDEADDVLTVTVKIGESSGAAASLFDPTPTVPSSGPEAAEITPTSTGVLTLTDPTGLAESSTDSITPGATLTDGASQPGGTVVLGSAL